MFYFAVNYFVTYYSYMHTVSTFFYDKTTSLNQLDVNIKLHVNATSCIVNIQIFIFKTNHIIKKQKKLYSKLTVSPRAFFQAGRFL